MPLITQLDTAMLGVQFVLWSVAARVIATNLIGWVRPLVHKKWIKPWLPSDSERTTILKLQKELQQANLPDDVRQSKTNHLQSLKIMTAVPWYTSMLQYLLACDLCQTFWMSVLLLTPHWRSPGPLLATAVAASVVSLWMAQTTTSTAAGRGGVCPGCGGKR